MNELISRLTDEMEAGSSDDQQQHDAADVIIERLLNEMVSRTASRRNSQRRQFIDKGGLDLTVSLMIRSSQPSSRNDGTIAGSMRVNQIASLLYASCYANYDCAVITKIREVGPYLIGLLESFLDDETVVGKLMALWPILLNKDYMRTRSVDNLFVIINLCVRAYKRHPNDYDVTKNAARIFKDMTHAYYLDAVCYNMLMDDGVLDAIAIMFQNALIEDQMEPIVLGLETCDRIVTAAQKEREADEGKTLRRLISTPNLVSSILEIRENCETCEGIRNDSDDFLIGLCSKNLEDYMDDESVKVIIETEVMQKYVQFTWMRDQVGVEEFLDIYEGIRSFSKRFPHCDACKKMDSAKNLSRCSLCKCVWYCGRACQKARWKDHKQYCRYLGACVA